MFSFFHSLTTKDTQICSKRPLRALEIPVTFQDDRDVWVDRLIELAVVSYEKKVRIDFYLAAYLEDVPELTAEEVNKIERSYTDSVNHFVDVYVDFDERFIDEKAPEQVVRQRAHNLFSGWLMTGPIENFGTSALNYFQGLTSQLAQP